ncbi:PREDICTED: LRR receptor-like serine/threonine-protein kinase GSO1 [Camelina sativa]|uniref:LRR receptor-like serine/threonine-protein kinase GSO1 n=1 Tax=Camelina sativa TaxID=90675 RepID=A0ABM1Q7D5_CAMSA|nr:PREDICTED: LRR receptor-like serine/threonine-protein kinase GSO1 [Camelina sativa]
MERKLFLCQYLIWVILLLGQLHGYKSCIEKERKALLELKEYLLRRTKEWEHDSVLMWTNDTKSDCCQWKGVECNRNSGRITEISFGIRYHIESSLLNLSLLHPFEELQSLNLSSSWFGYRGFTGLFDDVEGYKSLRRLRNLETLDLSFNEFNNNIFPFLNAATSLNTLFLRNNEMDGLFPVKELKDLTNLELLDLSGNTFNGSIPVRELSALTKLKALDLNNIEFSGSMKLQGKFAKKNLLFGKKIVLELRFNYVLKLLHLFNVGVCKLKDIEELDLSGNNLVGQFPLCITSLTGLRVLDLSSNNLTGKLPYTLGNIKSLEYLSLFDNNFEGVFSLGSLTNLSKLKVLKLSSTSNSLKRESDKSWKPKFQLSVISESSWKPKFQLSVISLETCNLEKVPHFLLNQKDLRHVDLSDNNIAGKFPYWLLENNTKLEVLLLRNNSFRSFQIPESDHNLLCLDVSVNEFDILLPQNIGWILPHLKYMNLANNGFQGHLPSSLGNMKELVFLDISHNNFYGKLPRSFLEGCYSLHMLKMSHNKLSGENILESANFTNISLLSMDNNQLTGKIGQGWRSSISLQLLDISNNKFSSVIPSWIGELPRLHTLLLSNNSLEGEIPLSLFNISVLLDLSANMLSGGIPSLISSRYPRILLLQGNNLSEAIPDTLLGNVKVLDLRYNRFSGNIPEFINTQIINILLLRGNHLSGQIPYQLCGLSSIQLLDLSNNKLNGSIPLCLSYTSSGFGIEDTFEDYFYDYDSEAFSAATFLIDFKSMIVKDQFMKEYETDIQTKIEFATKHRYDAYMGRNLKLLFGLDLSENELSGEIPLELGGLLKVQALNLSHNKLSGVIPESFSALKNVESLDLSFNSLQGRIPPQLTDLSSLAVFNVSYNNLSGVIPEGRQFNTFDTQSYLGNPLLCGRAIDISCNGNTFHEPENGIDAHDSTIDIESFY